MRYNFAMAVVARAWRVEGRVQGVGFRYFVVKRALELGLSGWTMNLYDGSVEVAAAGPEAALDALEAAISAGPPHARVERARRIEPPAALENVHGFTVQY